VLPRCFWHASEGHDGAQHTHNTRPSNQTGRRSVFEPLALLRAANLPYLGRQRAAENYTRLIGKDNECKTDACATGHVAARLSEIFILIE
jgi:hypothetical protein